MEAMNNLKQLQSSLEKSVELRQKRKQAMSQRAAETLVNLQAVLPHKKELQEQHNIGVISKVLDKEK